YGAISANLDADIKATGNLGNKIAVSVAGLVAVNDFHFGKKAGDDYASFKKLAIDMKEINPLGYKYIFDSIMLNEPYFKFERYDYLDNVQREFGKGGGNVKAAYADSSKFNLIIELAKYIRDLSKNLVQSYYKADKIAIYSADMKFNDFSLREKFGVSGNPLNLYTDSIDKNKQRMVVNLKTALKPYGNVSVKLSLDPNDFGYFDLEYSIQKIPLAMFNPYVISYTSFPLDRGTFEFNGYLSVDDSVIKSDNHILIIDPRVAKRLRKKDTKWLPVPLMMSVVRGPGDAIDYDIPISGDLRNPKFHFKDVILSVLSNLFVKPPATPYLIHEKHVENQVEKLLTIKWQTHSTELLPKQEKFAEKMAKFLGDNPQTSVTVSPLEYTEKEKEYVLFFEAKKKYFQLKHGGKNLQITEDDSLAIEKMSVKDSLFVKYMNKFIGDTNMFTIQEKCIAFIGSGTVNAKYEQLLKDRQGAFMAFFKSTGAEKQVKVATSKSSVPYDGFSYYKIDYKGELPKDLQKATEEMNDLDQEAPRVRFKKARDRNGGIVPEIKGK
ncbi:MAG: hypothetical protein JWO06_1309, partial [Bacteroidota bacterium]|nr:hypothetical protein [Bacteroidota bacterium]